MHPAMGPRGPRRAERGLKVAVFIGIQTPLPPLPPHGVEYVSTWLTGDGARWLDGVEAAVGATCRLDTQGRCGQIKGA